MERIANNAATKAIISKYGFAVKKRLGQNFLVDTHVLGKILRAAEITDQDLVIEIGPGLGALTQPLCEAAKRVVAVEKDAMLIPILSETLAGCDNAQIIHGDGLTLDFTDIIGTWDGDVKVVANLPYYAATAVLMRLLETRAPVKSITVMVQKEVAQRLSAAPGSKDYGSLTLITSYFAQAYLAANVPRNCFVPRPNVDSAVVRLDVRDVPAVDVSDEAMFFDVIRLAFAMRRKTLQNCLDGAYGWTKADIRATLSRCGLDEQVRGEALSLEDFARLMAELVSEVGPL